MINLSELNKEQLEAVQHTEGPLLVLACPGSGKTKMMTYKIAYLLDKGVAPRNILAITFTNKAANEMKERTLSLCKNIVDKNDLTLCTFHKFCISVLRRYIYLIGFDKNFTVYDVDDAKKVIKRILTDRGIKDDKKWKPIEILGKISWYKNQLNTPDDLLKENDPDLRLLGSFWKEYQDRMKKANSVDFDDILCLTLKLFQEHTAVAQAVGDKYTYLFVDEYQDTNKVQVMLIKCLEDYKAQPNFTVVGDEDQSIYRFRGADDQNLSMLQTFFPKLEIIKLVKNYRSTNNILNVAHSIILNNPNRTDKDLYSDLGEGDKVQYRNFNTDLDEAKQIVDKIKRLNDYKNCAILYRSNYMSRRFEDELLKNKIPYVIKHGLSFYDRAEVKDIISYLKLLVNPNDVEAFSRIVNIPKKGIGGVTIQKVISYCAVNNIPILDALSTKLDDMGIKGKTKESLIAFCDIFNTLKKEVKIDEMVQKIYSHLYEPYLQTEYGKFSKDYDEEILKNKYQNIMEIKTLAVNYVDGYIAAHSELNEDEKAIIKNNSATILTDFINDLSLSSPEDKENPDPNRVNLMTMHGAKGLEFDHVFVVGMNEGMIPSANAINSPDIEAIPEERRLCYVALTRAKKNLYLTGFKSGYLYGQYTDYIPSRFINEMDRTYVN